MEGIQTIQALKAVQSSLPAQTTIPSDELVMLYAADGTPIAKIARDDLVKAVASVMASNSQNTFSKLLGVQANGTPMGIGASDLASVLGGSDAGNLVIVRNSFEGDIYQGLDIFKQQILTWYQNLPSGSIIVAKFNYPGNGVVFGIKSSDSYGNFVMLSDGTESYKYINVSGGNISTNITL